MKMLPGSHRLGEQQHDLSDNSSNNVLYQGQTIHNIDDSNGMLCPLKPGQASLHHGWTMHSSAPNSSDDRRIGLNIQYIAPHVQQAKMPGYSALLLRGEDRFHHYTDEKPANSDYDQAAEEWRTNMDDLYQKISAQPQTV